MQPVVCSPITDDRWKDLVEAHPASSVFQHPSYMEVLARTYKHLEPVGIVLKDEQGRYAAGIPFFLVRSWLTGRRLVSLPFSSYSDPLAGTKEEFQLLLDETLRFSSRNRIRYIEFKLLNGGGFLAENPLWGPCYDQKTHILELSQGAEALQRRFDRTNVRQKISRAQKSGITVRNSTTEEDLRAFYELLLKARKRLGLPPQFFEFFLNMWRLLAPPGIVHLLCADMQGKPVGFLLYFKFKKTISAEYIATEEDKFPLGVNQILFWSAISQGISEGYEFFDFGKSGINNPGLLSAKGRWGAAERDAPTFYFPGTKAGSSPKQDRSAYRLMSYLYRTMPAALSETTSRFLYRHMG
jgi:CelD/BcsL family acetyltransferase involved in cellulose biosynthesis